MTVQPDWNSSRSQNYRSDGFKNYNELPRPICSAEVCSRNVIHKGKRNTGRKKCLGCSFAKEAY